MPVPSFPIATFVREYCDTHRELIDGDPEFAAWLHTEYRPLVGGWQY